MSCRRATSAEVLGVALDKELQTSDWGARPLAPAQLAYAALDAFVPPTRRAKERMRCLHYIF